VDITTGRNIHNFRKSSLLPQSSCFDIKRGNEDNYEKFARDDFREKTQMISISPAQNTLLAI